MGWQVFSRGDVVLRQDRKVTWTAKTGSMRVLFNDLKDPLKIVLVPQNRLRCPAPPPTPLPQPWTRHGRNARSEPLLSPAGGGGG